MNVITNECYKTPVRIRRGCTQMEVRSSQRCSSGRRTGRGCLRRLWTSYPETHRNDVWIRNKIETTDKPIQHKCDNLNYQDL